MAANGMHNLTTLIKRLEAATARLEDIAESTVVSSGPATSKGGASSSEDVSAADEPLPEVIEDYDAILNDAVAKYVHLSKGFGGVLATQAELVQEGFNAQRQFLLVTTRARKPDIHGADLSLYQALLKPTNEALVAVTEIKEGNRASPVFHHLSAVAEGIMMLAWVTVENRPYKHVEEAFESARFFGNRVLTQFKDTEPKQADWVRAYYQIFNDLAEYARQHFPGGVQWNRDGQSVGDVLASMKPASSTSAPAPSAGGPPPPPPPPPGPPPKFDIKEAPAPAGKAGLGAVFSELNQGSAVTSGLRKVDRSEMTHKNPSLRAAGGPPPRSKSPMPGPKPDSLRTKKPARTFQEGNKWIIENHDHATAPIEIEASMSHNILISKCNTATIVIKGKATAVTVENSTRVSLVVDSLVSQVDAIKGSNFALQVLGVVPTILLDQIDSAQIYLSAESSGTRIFSSKSAGINLNIVAGEDDYREVPLPSQIESYWDTETKQLVNQIVEHSG